MADYVFKSNLLDQHLLVMTIMSYLFIYLFMSYLLVMTTYFHQIKTRTSLCRNFLREGGAKIELQSYRVEKEEV